MAESVSLNSRSVYSDSVGCVQWEGRVVESEHAFKRYMREVVRPHAADKELLFEQEMLGLAVTNMETQFVSHLLNARPQPKSSDLGEALAELGLRDDLGWQVHWP